MWKRFGSPSHAVFVPRLTATLPHAILSFIQYGSPVVAYVSVEFVVSTVISFPLYLVNVVDVFTVGRWADVVILLIPRSYFGF